MVASRPSPRECLVPFSDVSAVTLPVRGINQPHPDSQTPLTPSLIYSFIRPQSNPSPLCTLLVNIETCESGGMKAAISGKFSSLIRFLKNQDDKSGETLRKPLSCHRKIDKKALHPKSTVRTHFSQGLMNKFPEGKPNFEFLKRRVSYISFQGAWGCLIFSDAL